MCNERATELIKLFEEKLKDINVTSIFVHFRHQWFLPHAWVEVEINYLNNNGEPESVFRKYDAWKEDEIPINRWAD